MDKEQSDMSKQNARTWLFKRIRVSRVRLQEQLMGYLFISPSMLLLGAFMFLPMLIGISFSFHETWLANPPGEFIGWQNYEYLLKDPIFAKSIGASLKIALMLVPAEVVVGLGLALLVNTDVKGVGVPRTIFLLPIAMGGVVTAAIWRLLFNRDLGIFNSFLQFFGIPAQPFLLDPKLALLAVVIMSVWSYVGVSMVIYLAGLQAIPEDYYEAAKVDGAGSIDCIRYITVPLLRRTTLYVIVMNTIFAFRLFDSIYTLTQGGPQRATTVLAYYSYQLVFMQQDLGYGATVGVALMVIIMIITGLQLYLFRGGAEYTG